jgi:hypothetical protein
MDLDLNSIDIEIICKYKHPNAAFRTPVSVLRVDSLLFVANEDKKRGLQLWNFSKEGKKLKLRMILDNMIEDICESVFGLEQYNNTVYVSDRAAPKVLSANVDNIQKL